MRRKIKRAVRKLRSVIRHRHELKQVVDAHLYFLEHRGVTVWGGISEADELGIREAVARAARFDGPIVEIGALFGWTTQLLASLKSPAKELIAVDNFCWNPFMLPADDHRVIARRTLHYCLEHCRTRLFDGSTEEFYRSYAGETPSMVFIDADHSYAGASSDIAWARAMGVPVVVGHDYQDLHPGVVRAVDENFAGRFQVFGSVWIADGRREAESSRLAA
jgi:hypothetical protein